MIAPLRRVLVRRPDAAFGNADPARWHYASKINLDIVQREHDDFCDLLHRAGAEVIYHDLDLPEHADAIFTFDPSLMTTAGAILLSMGKSLRRGEEAAQGRMFEKLGIPIYAKLDGDARAEGGDTLWLDERTLAVGIGFRTNRKGAQQLHDHLRPLSVEVLAYDLPYFTGPDACLHLLSLISIVDEKLAVVYPPLLPVALWQELDRRGFRLVEAPQHEFEKSQATNVLATKPGECIMLEGNPITQQRLIDAGCEVQTYRGYELSFKAEGGATCLTRPIWREG